MAYLKQDCAIWHLGQTSQGKDFGLRTCFRNLLEELNLIPWLCKVLVLGFQPFSCSMWIEIFLKKKAWVLLTKTQVKTDAKSQAIESGPGMLWLLQGCLLHSDTLRKSQNCHCKRVSLYPMTFGIDLPAYSDALGTREKCHWNQIVIVSRGSLLTYQSFRTCWKCHCKRGVTVHGDICIRRS